MRPHVGVQIVSVHGPGSLSPLPFQRESYFNAYGQDARPTGNLIPRVEARHAVRLQGIASCRVSRIRVKLRQFEAFEDHVYEYEH